MEFVALVLLAVCIWRALKMAEEESKK